MPQRSPRKPHQLVRDRLSVSALAGGRKLYLSSGVHELRIDVRRRRYSGLVRDGQQTATVKIEHSRGAPTWYCSIHGADDTNCEHVAALLTAIREREAVEATDEKTDEPKGPENLVDHLLARADRDHLVQAFRLCLKSYPDIQGDLVFTLLENLETDGELYEEVVRLIAEGEKAATNFIISGEGFDHFRLVDELNYLLEQKKYRPAFLLARSILQHYLNRQPRSRRSLSDEEVDLMVASTGVLNELSTPPAPEQLAEQVHGLALKLLRQHQRIDPQFQSSLIALLNHQLLDAASQQELEQLVRRRWERARRAGSADNKLAEQLAMPLALLLARTQQFDKLQQLFDRYLKNPILRAPALAEMLQHDMGEVVFTYMKQALMLPDPTTRQLDTEDIARCAMYNDLVMMMLDALREEQIDDKIDLLFRAFHSIGYRVYDLVEFFKEYVDEGQYRTILQQLLEQNSTSGQPDSYPTVVKRFILLCELARIDEAFSLIAESDELDPIVVLAFLPRFFPTYREQLFYPALRGITELLPMVMDDNLRALVKQTISLLWNVNDEALRSELEEHYESVGDEELAAFISGLLDDFDPSDFT